MKHFAFMFSPPFAHFRVLWRPITELSLRFICVPVVEVSRTLRIAIVGFPYAGSQPAHDALFTHYLPNGAHFPVGIPSVDYEPQNKKSQHFYGAVTGSGYASYESSKMQQFKLQRPVGISLA
jgi:hypothetical protein